MVSQILHIRIIKHLLLNVISNRLERLGLLIFQSGVDISKQGECSRVECSFSEPLGQVGFTWYVKLSLSSRAD